MLSSNEQSAWMALKSRYRVFFGVAVCVVCFLILAGCSLLPTRTVTVKLIPPAELVQDCPEPSEVPASNGALARNRNDYRSALRLCNNDKAALRDWSKDAK